MDVKKESGGQLIERGSLVAVGGGGYLLSGGLIRRSRRLVTGSNPVIS